MSKYRKMLYFCYVLIGFNLVFSSFVNYSNFEITKENQKMNCLNDEIPFPIASASYIITGDVDLDEISSGGIGTFEDPYILPFDEINASKSPVGLLIQNTTKYLLIQNLYIHSADQSNLNLTNVQNVQIFNCNFQSALHSGIFLDNCSNVNITECEFGNNGEDWIEGDLIDGGLEIINSSQILIDSNIITSNNQTGINLYSCNDTQIQNNTISFNKPIGILASHCQDLSIHTNTVFNNSLFKWDGEVIEGEGLRLLNSNQTTCISNNFTLNYKYGLNIISAFDLSIEDNDFNLNNFYYHDGYDKSGISGIDIDRSFNISICGNNITNGGLEGIKAVSVEGIIVENNRIENHFSDGIYINDNTEIEIRNNKICNNSFNGILLFYSSYCQITGNIISNHSTQGLYIFTSENFTVEDNSIKFNSRGIWSYALTNGIFSLNNVTQNSQNGFEVLYGSNITIESNIFSENTNNLYLSRTNDNLISKNYFEKPQFSNIVFFSTQDCNITFNYVNMSKNYDLNLMGAQRSHIFGNYLGNITYDNQETNYWNNTNIGNCWANYLDFYSEAIAVNGVYNTPYQRILNSSEEISYGLNFDNLPITSEYFVNLTNFFEPQFDPAPPILDDITSPDTDGNFTLSWSSVPLVSGYNLYVSNSSIDDVGNLTNFHDTILLSFNIVNYPNGTYFFAVTAFNASGESLPSNSIQVVVAIEPVENPPLSPPELLPADLDEIGYDTDGNITLHWNAVPGAEFYKVYLSTQPISSIGSLNPIGNTTQTSYFISGLTNGSYYFTIVAVNSSSTSTISNVISVDVEIEENKSNDPPILPVVLVFMSVGGTAIGITAANVTPVDKIVTTIKNRVSKSTTPSDIAPKNDSTGIETTGDKKGIIKNDSPPQMQSDPSFKLLEMPNGTPISIASIPNLSPTDLAAALKHHWAQIPKNTRNLVLKAVDNYLKFKDQAELILLNTHHALALSYLSTFMAFREGSKSESISTLQKISEDAKEAEFENLSHEAQKTADELKSQDSENDIDDKIEDTGEDEINSDELIEQDEEEK
ncbi:hypothetical protein NEF87_001791 [Candidatus Lokiarchaeum ossiferum]|uniref:Fibronectin type-III domain-containing protein n=1 Tax=Candidatus Lokiarchaeum ossiferum TaxID=2951803 RepID=A0ABY6HPR1_9ARCH|nr:hypothetical protein NEF87_001791 [Candidatus Lokiarchaeum sp. B-35]